MKIGLSLCLVLLVLALTSGMRIRQDANQDNGDGDGNDDPAFFEAGTPDPQITWTLLANVFGANEGNVQCFNDVNDCVAENTQMPGDSNEWNSKDILVNLTL